MTQANESRPRQGTGAAIGGASNTSPITPDSTRAPRIPRLSRADIERSIPTYVLIVRSPSARTNRRLFLSLHGAVRALERARDRGHAATLELARVLPVGDTGLDAEGVHDE